VCSVMREIGSDFEYVDDSYLLPRHLGRAWATLGGASYLASGRQALLVVAREIRSRGYSRVFLPQHHCESMRGPFEYAGLVTVLVPVAANDLAMDAYALDELIDTHGTGAILHCETFGIRTRADLLDVLSSQARKGIPVISDDTHTLFDPSPGPYAYRVASLRKLLPLADGGYAMGLDDEFSSVGNAEAFVALRERAAAEKTAYLHGDHQDKRHLRTFAQAERLAEELVEPAPMSQQSSALLLRLNLGALAERRSANAAALIATLDAGGQVEVVGVGAAAVGARPYVAIRTRDGAKLRRQLVPLGIYCPIHWPRPGGLAADASWDSGLLSLPVDHRYDHADMVRIAQEVTRLAATRGSG
jgi:hypothetical protein